MTTLFDSARVVKSESFALGIQPVRRPFVPSIEDLEWAAQFFGDLEADRLLEEEALEAAWNDQFNDTFPSTDRCLMCGESSDDLSTTGLCDRCELIALENSFPFRV
jgi:hypothetical protein